ncbi:MAG: tetratricopeptide repeat protein [Phycisphaerae bacterium]
MSYLLETVGRGLVTHLHTIFRTHFPHVTGDTIDGLSERLTHSPRAVDLWLRLGRLQLFAANLVEAQKAFEIAGEIEPLCRLARIGLACVANELGEDERTLRLLRAAQVDDPSDPAIAFALALTQERMEDPALSIAAYRAAIDVCPHLRNAYERLAALALVEGNLDEAAACYEQLVEMEPDDIDLLITLGTIQLNMGQPECAIEQFQNALLVEPESDDSLCLRDSDTRGGDDLTTVLGDLNRFIQKYPDAAMYRVQIADIYSRVGEDQLATEHYQAALVAQPGYLEATVKLATHHLRNRRLQAAAQGFARAVELNDRLMLAFVGLAVAQQTADRVAESNATLDLAAGIESSCCLLLSETFRLHLQSTCTPLEENPLTDETERGLETLTLDDVIHRHRRVLAESPNRADLHYFYGVLLRQSARFRDAVGAFERALAINPHYAKALLKLGVGLREAGDEPAGRHQFQAAFRYDRASIRGRYRLALLYAQPNKFRFAMEECRLQESHDPLAADFAANLPLMLQTIGLADGTAALWEGLRELSEDRNVLTHSRRVALSRSSSADEA